MAQYYPIKGIPLPAKPDPQHPIPLRKEVTAWSSDPNNAIQLSLFIQALIQFQEMPVKEKLSYYQISGIHGYPATSWDGEAGPSQFYCNHQRTTFPTWHRPYMLLFEQRLYEIMMGIVSKIKPDSEKAIWEIEASHWRLPYWDWAQNQPYLQTVGIPQLFTLEWITVVMPGRTWKGFPNPLWKFSNPGGKPMGSPDNGQWKIPKGVTPVSIRSQCALLSFPDICASGKIVSAQAATESSATPNRLAANGKKVSITLEARTSASKAWILAKGR
jgi:tyrosinase